MIKDVWENCYEERWKGKIYPESICHPAKFSRGLIRRIYNHAIENKWIKKGDTVLDPFGGVALGALDAITLGLNWVGVELEEKFVKLGEQNISFWKERLRNQYLGTAKIIQGDSRNLKYTIDRTDLIISSPPFMDNNVNIGAVGNTLAMRQQIHNSKKRSNSYGQTPGQLGNMKEGDLRSTDSDTFWPASREIVQECYNILNPNSYVIWVTKDYVKDGKRVLFSNNWITLCKSVGFKVVCWHYAMVVKEIPQHTFDGSKVIKERKSFFRRLAESKGSPKIDWEDVVCMVK